jgi:hypothetical protein
MGRGVIAIPALLRALIPVGYLKGILASRPAA